MLNALTIDVEDYYQVSAYEPVVRFEDWERYESRVERNTQRILNILQERNVKATFFVLGWVAERYPKIVKAIHTEGHEIASHGYAHRLVYQMGPDKFREDISKAKAILEEITGELVTGYRAPSYSITQQSLWGLDILVDEGFQYDSSIFPIRHDRYGIPKSPRFPHWIRANGGSLVECPLSTVRIGGMTVPVGGGGYLRFYPFAFTKWAVRQINEKEKQPVIVYTHPWEIDPEQPIIPSSRLTTWRHRINLDKTEGRLKHLLNDFRFGPLRDVLLDLKLFGDGATRVMQHAVH